MALQALPEVAGHFAEPSAATCSLTRRPTPSPSTASQPQTSMRPSFLSQKTRPDFEKQFLDFFKVKYLVALQALLEVVGHFAEPFAATCSLT